MIMRQLLHTAIWTLLLCGISYAQDRGSPSSIAWSPDGETIAVASTSGLWLFDNEFNELGAVRIEHGRSLSRLVEWNATGDLVALAELFFDPIRVVDIGELRVVTEIYDARSLSSLRWHPSANRIVSGTFFGETRIWEAITGEEVFHFDSHALYPNDGKYHETMGVCWFNDGALIIVLEERMFIVDVDKESILKEFGPDAFFSAHVECNPEHEILSRHGQLFDLETATLTWDFLQDSEHNDPGPHPEPVAVKWSPDSRLIVANFTGCLIRVYDGRTGKLIAEMPGGTSNLGASPYYFVDSIDWRPDGSRFAVVGDYGIRVWDSETFELLLRFDGFGEHPNVVARMEKGEKPRIEPCP